MLWQNGLLPRKNWENHSFSYQSLSTNNFCLLNQTAPWDACNCIHMCRHTHTSKFACAIYHTHEIIVLSFFIIIYFFHVLKPPQLSLFSKFMKVNLQKFNGIWLYLIIKRILKVFPFFSPRFFLFAFGNMKVNWFQTVTKL